MLSGVGIFFELLRQGQICVSSSDLILQDTVFDFVVSGIISLETANKVHYGLIKEENTLDKTLEKF